MLAECLHRQATVLHVLSLTIRREFSHRPLLPPFPLSSQRYSTQAVATAQIQDGIGTELPYDVSEAGFWGDVFATSRLSRRRKRGRKDVRKAEEPVSDDNGMTDSVTMTDLLEIVEPLETAEPLKTTDPPETIDPFQNYVTSDPLQKYLTSLTQPQPSTSDILEAPFRRLDHILTEHRDSPHELFKSLRLFIITLPSRPSRLPDLETRVHLLTKIAGNLSSPFPKSPRRYHNILQILWAEIIEVVAILKGKGLVEQVLARGPIKGLQLSDFDSIISSLIHHPPTETDSHFSQHQGAWKRVDLASTLDLVVSIFGRLSATQFEAVLRHYGLFMSDETPLSIRQARRQTNARQKQIAQVTKRWETRRSLITTLEHVLAQKGYPTLPSEGVGQIHPDSRHEIATLELTRQQVCAVCLDDIARLDIGQTSDTQDLERNADFWRQRRDAILISCQERLRRPDGILERWAKLTACVASDLPGHSSPVENGTSLATHREKAELSVGMKEQNPGIVTSTPMEERSIKLLLSDAVRRNGVPSHALDCQIHGAPRLDDPLDLVRLYLGVSRRRLSESPQGDLTEGAAMNLDGVILIARNYFYDTRSFYSLCSLIEILLGGPLPNPSSAFFTVPAPRLGGKVFANLILAARNPDQFAYILILLLRLPNPRDQTSIEPVTRRMLFHFAYHATLQGNSTLLPPDDPLRPLVEKEGFIGLLNHAFKQWGVGLPYTVYNVLKRIENGGEKFKSGQEVDTVLAKYPINTNFPKTLTQKTPSKHIDSFG
ncbi:hypothetical protein BCR39DRAFT_587007 [Naematelia encephala]|uniref:Uncharacterized protein n=1 Tax=Naematelia encephala TaxID=71784 RepID=A0A1Y2BBQ7_9TREE|nr:hypothetical protein BCR39DRAFT_587007 [Naematelia encephala]